ncbi:MAG: hypothetical protein WAN93_11095 [Solirubrobacteraceae bacterium]
MNMTTLARIEAGIAAEIVGLDAVGLPTMTSDGRSGTPGGQLAQGTVRPVPAKSMAGSLAVLVLVEVKRAAEYPAGARAPADRAAAARAPRAFRKRWRLAPSPAPGPAYSMTSAPGS